MAFNRIQARRLLGANELQLFEASLGEPLATATAPQLRALIKRARVQRDKASDLLRRQRVATQVRTGHKSGVTGSDNARTAQKEQALGEALARLEKRLAQLEAAVERAAAASLRARARLAAEKQRANQDRVAAPAKGLAARKLKATPPTRPGKDAASPATSAPAARSRKAPAAAPQAGAKGLPAASAGALAAAAGRQRQFTGSQSIQAHVASRGRRQQARRDQKP